MLQRRRHTSTNVEMNHEYQNGRESSRPNQISLSMNQRVRTTPWWPRPARIATAIIVFIAALFSLPLQSRVHATAGGDFWFPQPASVSIPALRATVIQEGPALPAVKLAAVPTATPTESPTLVPPNLTAKAVYAVDVTDHSVLYAQNADSPLPPASTTKIITAIVVVRHASPGALVTIEQSDTVDGTIYSHMGLIAGDVVSVRSLLAGMLLNSGGDAAYALARYVGGLLPDQSNSDPRQRFVDEMNRVSSQLGMTNTHFVDPDGRDTPGHLTTAHDLAIAAADLFKYQLLQQLVDTRSETVPVQGPNARDITLYNTNELLGSPDVHGVKTGTTDAAGQCLVLAVWRGNARVITVVLGSTDRYADTNSLLDYLDQQFKWVRLGRGGDLQDLNAELANKGYSLAITKTVLLTTSEADQLHYSLSITPSSDKSPLAAQGEVVFLIGSRPIWRIAVYAGDPFKKSA